jgi:hypothetical protein
MGPEIKDSLSEQDKLIPPRFFQHEALLKSFEDAKTLDQTGLVNTINYVHFKDGFLYVLLQHPVYQDKILIKSHPRPCLDNQLTCVWDESYFQYKLESYHALYLVIMKNQSMIFTPVNILSSSKSSFTIQLPEKSFVLNLRKVRRYPCTNVFAELMQSDFVARSELIDFSSGAFRIKAYSEAFRHNNWFNPDVPASVRIFSDEKIIYTGFCKCIRWQDNHNISKEIVFAAESDHISRFLAKKIRNPRKHISPPLAAVFEHPFLKKKIHRDIFDISTTGFSITEKPDEDLLMPGMMIHDLSILIAGFSILKCAAQIIYRRKGDNNIRYGIAILDMDIHSYGRINHILSINSDPQISVSSEVDMEALWEFFFQTGFIYPEKYRFCMDHREKFIETYRKLYLENPEIAKHITYEKNGQIFGHMSMIRAYERTWLIHHHAARPMGESKLPGFIVLRQMMIFLHGMYQLSSANMDYVICYFRPENKFPDRVFGGFARELNNQQACSLDLFSYLTLPVTSPEKPLPNGWLLKESAPSDLWELEQFYKNNSGGLLLNILRLTDSDPVNDSVEKVFERLGFLRKWCTYSLIYQDNLKAVFVVEQSDLAINMSDLLNCIKVLVTDPAGMPPELLSTVASKLGGVYNLDKVTLLIYPAQYAESAGFYCKKRYQLWITDMRYSNQFMDFVQGKFRMQYV